jgi:hypothetical protein
MLKKDETKQNSKKVLFQATLFKITVSLFHIMSIFIHFYLNAKQVYLFHSECQTKSLIFFYSIDSWFF